MLQRFFSNPEKRVPVLLGLITLLGAILRFRDLGSVSMTADEVSALLRLQFNSFSEMIDGGVRPDGHPAFVQVLLWFWTKAFGLSEFAVRFPFALFGTASIWLTGIIARKWFSDFTAIAAAAAMAFLEFPLMYSQLARPYAAGLFFTLLAAWFLTAFLQHEKISKWQIAGFAFAAAGAAYSHYFSLLEAGLFGILGLFFVPKQNRKALLIACVIAVAVFLPYFGIFMDQLKTGGIGGPGGWLGKPKPEFLISHLRFVFNGSAVILIAVCVLFFTSIFFFFKKPGKYQLLAILLWIIPFLTGYLYSVIRNPVLQDSVLLFAFPFLMMFLFSWFPEYVKSKLAPLFPLLVGVGLMYYSVGYKPYVLTDHFGRLKELVEESINWQEQNGNGKVDIAYNVDAPYFVQYYYDRFGKKQTNVLATINNGDQELNAFRKLVQQSDADYFVYAWSTKYSPAEIPEIIREKFPYLISRNLWFNSALYVFARQANGNYIRESGDEIFRNCNSFDPNLQLQPAWSKPCGNLLQDSATAPKPDSLAASDAGSAYWIAPADYRIRLDSACMYSPSLKIKAGTIISSPDQQIVLSTRIKLEEAGAQAVLVIQFERGGKTFLWNGRESGTQTDLNNTSEWQPVYFGLQVSDEIRQSDSVHVFIYSKDGKSLLLDEICLKTIQGHPGIYGARADLAE